MLKCCSLYSGSSGNSFFIQSDNSKILIDAGVSCKKIETALKNDFNLNLNDIDAVFVTHEYLDHSKGLNLIFLSLWLLSILSLFIFLFFISIQE